MSGGPGWGPPPQAPALEPREVAVWWLDRAVSRPVETVIARYLGVEPAAVNVGRSAGGKPEVEGSPYAVSLAHSGDVTLVAVSQAPSVGVDVEALRANLDGWALPRQALTEAERIRLEQAPPDERAVSFLAVWTRKEALLKAAGTGLALDPQLVELDGLEVVAVPPELGDPRSWTLSDLALPGHLGAAALWGPLSQLRLYRPEG